MDQQTLINGLFGIVGTGVAWWVKNVWDMVRSLQAQVTDLNVNLAKNYVPRVEMESKLDRIMDKLDEIQREMRG
jgi:hypothetical protein